MFFPQIQLKTKKKRVLNAIWDYIWPEFVGFIRAGWLLCSNLDGWTSIFRWGDAKSRWGDANFRWGDASPPHNLSTGYNVALQIYRVKNFQHPIKTIAKQKIIHEKTLKRLVLYIQIMINFLIYAPKQHLWRKVI